MFKYHCPTSPVCSAATSAKREHTQTHRQIDIMVELVAFFSGKLKSTVRQGANGGTVSAVVTLQCITNTRLYARDSLQIFTLSQKSNWDAFTTALMKIAFCNEQSSVGVSVLSLFFFFFELVYFLWGKNVKPSPKRYFRPLVGFRMMQFDYNKQPAGLLEQGRLFFFTLYSLSVWSLSLLVISTL